MDEKQKEDPDMPEEESASDDNVSKKKASDQKDTKAVKHEDDVEVVMEESQSDAKTVTIQKLRVEAETKVHDPHGGTANVRTFGAAHTVDTYDTEAVKVIGAFLILYGIDAGFYALVLTLTIEFRNDVLYGYFAVFMVCALGLCGAVLYGMDYRKRQDENEERATRMASTIMERRQRTMSQMNRKAGRRGSMSASGDIKVAVGYKK